MRSVCFMFIFGAYFSAASLNAAAPNGKALFTQHCVLCHGVNADGKGPAGAALKPPPRNLKKDPFKSGDSLEAIFKTTSNGLPGTAMVGYAYIPEADRRAIAQYVYSLRPKKAPAAVGAKKK